jgi:uncharacterized lipoprotein YmbA
MTDDQATAMCQPIRRSLGRCAAGAALAVLALLAMLAACSIDSSPVPPISWVRLPALAVAERTAPAAAVPGTWQLMLPLRLPGHLDRSAMLVPQGGAGLQPLGGVRWAEALVDAVPRLLREDLSREFGTPLWIAPLPPVVTPTRQLRVEFSAFDVAADGRRVELRARWNLADARGGSAPLVFDAAFVTPAGGDGVDALVLAHRQALARLARRIADSAR